MRQGECVAFLKWCLPKMRMRWEGFRKVRSQVCKRLGRRIKELGLEDLDRYRMYLDVEPEEWAHLDSMCRITISRFFRDRGVFEALESDVLPALAESALERGDRAINAWCCGCASGEEVYALAVLWKVRAAGRFPDLRLDIVATDADPAMLERARRGVYTEGSIRELPADLRRAAFDATTTPYRIRKNIGQRVAWLTQDVRTAIPAETFDLVLCRNLVLTYFDEALQREVMERVLSVLRPGGALVIGSHERLPALSVACPVWKGALPIYRLAA
jgi:chemotaxis protein methyltransferase CheR